MKTRLLIVGSSGMLGHTLFNRLFDRYEVFGVQRSDRFISSVPSRTPSVFKGVDVTDTDKLNAILRELRPQVVVNCVGVIKQFKETLRRDFVRLNSMFPHELAGLCGEIGARMFHFSTDCVFDGKIGRYSETDPPTATDDYGISKYLGEVIDQRHALTLRTSIIGHEIGRSLSLIDWFLAQKGLCKGFTGAIYSGLPTVEVADFIPLLIEKHGSLSGLYHLSSAPINKYELLKKVAAVYKKSIEIVPDNSFVIDRSLLPDLLHGAVGADFSDWDGMIRKMHGFYQEHRSLYA